MKFSCEMGDAGVVAELLDMGFDPSVVETRDIGYSFRPARVVVPLAAASAGKDPGPVVDLLLARGADPNTLCPGSQFQGDISPMHAAIASPVALQKLIDAGGNVNVRSIEDGPGQGLLDYFRWYYNSPSDDPIEKIVSVLAILHREGISTAMNDGSSFLASCWGSGYLRNRLTRILSVGFNPRERGNGKGTKGASLYEHLEKKVKAGKGGPQAAELLASFNADILGASTSRATGKSVSPRL